MSGDKPEGADHDEAARMLFEGGQVGEHEVAELQRETAADWKWCRGARMVFMCALCGKAQAAAPPGANDGMSADQAEAHGWRIGDGSQPALCPTHNRELDQVAAGEEAPIVEEVASVGPGRRLSWRGNHWANEPIDPVG